MIYLRQHTCENDNQKNLTPVKGEKEKEKRNEVEKTCFCLLTWNEKPHLQIVCLNRIT